MWKFNMYLCGDKRPEALLGSSLSVYGLKCNYDSTFRRALPAIDNRSACIRKFFASERVHEMEGKSRVLRVGFSQVFMILLVVLELLCSGYGDYYTHVPADARYSTLQCEDEWCGEKW